MKLFLILTQLSILSFSYGLTFDEEVSSPALWSPHHIQLRKQWEQQEEEFNNKELPEKPIPSPRKSNDSEKQKT